MVKSYHMPRTCLSALLVLQLISTFERQIFDFLGYMWMPILGNFFNLVFVIFGLFGLYQYRIKYLLTYSIWTLGNDFKLYFSTNCTHSSTKSHPVPGASFCHITGQSVQIPRYSQTRTLVTLVTSNYYP